MNDEARVSPRLAYLDGLRGIAAAYVVLFHAVVGFAPADLPAWARVVRRAFAFGHEAVAIFIVLSGYSLMLPVARSPGAQLDVWGYFRRRARRILPPYYAALVVTLTLIAGVPALQQDGTGTMWDDSLPAFELAPIATHVLLMHNWLPSLAVRINGPLWSVASEWQIYFFFPFVLLPVWRLYGKLALLSAALVIGYTPLWLVTAHAMSAIPWYLFLFALGMAAAAVSYGEGEAEARLRRQINFDRLTRLTWLLCLVAGFGAAPLWFRLKPVTDAVVGFATASLLVATTQHIQTRNAHRPLLALLESRPIMALGRISYSLYLTHLPIVALCYFALVRLQLPLPAQLPALTLCGFVASWAFAAAFYGLVERHFVRAPRFSTRV